MPEYLYQYRREQRVTFTVEAETKAEADAEAAGREFKLWSEDDESDDPGELDLLDDAVKADGFALVKNAE